MHERNYYRTLPLSCLQIKFVNVQHCASFLGQPPFIYIVKVWEMCMRTCAKANNTLKSVVELWSFLYLTKRLEIFVDNDYK